MLKDPLDRGVEEVKGFATVPFKGWGNPTSKGVHSGGEATPAGKELEEVTSRRTLAGARDIRMLL